MELRQMIRWVIDPASYAKVLSEGLALGQKLGENVLRGVGNVEQRIQSRFSTMGQQAGEAFGKALPFSIGMAIERAVEFAIEKLKEITVALAHTAGEVQRVGIEFDSVFGAAGDSLDRFLSKSAPFYGTTSLALREMAANLGAMSVGFGMSRDGAASFVERLVTLTGDIATFKGQRFDETLHAVTGALVGITRPMHMLGVMITEATIKEEAFRITGKKHEEDLTQQEKALAALNVMYSLATPMMGAAERQQGSLNLVWQQMGAVVGDVFNKVAQDLIPTFAELLEWLKKQDWIGTSLDMALRIFGTLLQGVQQGVILFVEQTKVMYHSWNLMNEAMALSTAKFMKVLPWADKAYWKNVEKEASEGMDKTVAALKASAGQIVTQLSHMPDLFGEHYKLPTHAPGPMAPKAGAPDKNDPKELDKQVALIREGMKHEATRAEALKRSADLQARISAMLKAGVKDYETQVHLEKLMHELRDSDADAATEALRLRHADIQAMDKSEEKLRAIRQLKAAANTQRMNAKTEEEIKEWDKLLKSVNADLNAFSLPEQFVSAYEDAISGTERWSDALKELASDGRIVNTIMGSLGKGAARSMLTELRDLAHGKAIQNIAQGIEWLGHGIWDAAHLNPQAGAEFAAAGQAFAAAAEWGLLSGAAGVARGGSAAASAPGQTGGAQAAGSSTLPPVTYIYLDPLDADNVRAHQVVGGIVMQSIERGVVVLPTAAAPSSVRGNR